jgi:hypothetical protein
MFHLGRTVLAGVAGVALAMAITPPAGAATYYNLVNDKSGKCMSVAGGGSTANGAKIVQWTCNTKGEQLWYRVGDQLKNRKSGKCLSVAHQGDTVNGRELVQWSCNGAFEQMWRVSDGYLINHKNGKVASVSGGGSTANGAKLVQWTATGNPEQLWRWDARVIDA